MKAVVFNQFGPPSVLHVVEDAPKPERKQGEVLIKIAATSVNPVDWKTRAGLVPKFIVQRPKIPGGDLAGVVVDSDPSSRFAGKKVFSCTDGFQLWNKHGCYAQFFSAPEDQVAEVPHSISLTEAASMPLVALTAWQALEAASLQPGQRVLIHAGAGGVGTMAIQLAKRRWNLHVTTTCSARNIEFVKQLGADVPVDYSSQRFEEVCEPFDGVIDLIGGDIEIRSLKALKSSGVFVSVLNSGWQAKYGTLLAVPVTLWQLGKAKLRSALRLGPRYFLLLVRPNGQQLEEIASLVDQGALRPVIDHVLPLEQAAQAHEYLEKGHARGKVVLTVQDVEE